MIRGSPEVSLLLPHAVDAGPVQRIVLRAGVAVRLQGLRSAGLRQPLKLADLPASYLAEAYAMAELDEAESGFEKVRRVWFELAVASAVCARYSIRARLAHCLVPEPDTMVNYTMYL